MEAVGRLAGGIAHDFNNLLTAILGSAQLALRELEPSHTVREDLEEIRRAGLRAADLTRQLLAYSRRQVVAPKVIDVNDTLHALDSMLRRLIREDIDLVMDLAPRPLAVKSDAGQFEQVVLNLVVNARDALTHAGRIVVHTAGVVLGPVQPQNEPPAPPGQYVLLQVSDTGSGLTAEARAHLFEPFFTTKELGKGTGLGLATVYGIVKQNGGVPRLGNGAAGGGRDRGAPVRPARPRVERLLRAGRRGRRRSNGDGAGPSRTDPRARHRRRDARDGWARAGATPGAATRDTARVVLLGVHRRRVGTRRSA